ncbi:DUF1835 domain-containing protein [Desmospora activa]|uniref:Uncharacterized protein DUF1835 n=1 Tax=Desmospora activa DSM 45169 TaxID=1121389 RepID=A0A2T4Z3F3_9BACL|nr:DUF1835 domain-containing protein [Desmospora activa]PTM56422.1 uncharacterized protein DUF1835 [Desmospora activa DSM 45169]
MIHIVSGDVWGERLRNWRHIDGEVFVWREMMDFGPLSPNWSLNEQIRQRALFFEERIGVPREQMEMVCRYQEQRLERIPPLTPVVLWFDTDRFDQLLLLYLSSRIRNQGLQSVSLVEVPEVATVTEEQLDRLWEERIPIGDGELERAEHAWKALISPTPYSVWRWLREEPALFHLHRAFRSHLDYLPSVDNGLNKIEEQALQLVEQGCDRFELLFQEVSAHRLQDGLTDVHFAAILNELATPKGHPLLYMEREAFQRDQAPTEGPLHLTLEGKAVLAGEADRLDVAGIDWWLGGVHLVDGSWRLDTAGKPVQWKA